MNTQAASTAEHPAMPQAGGYAPQSFTAERPPGFVARTAARSSFLLCLVASSLFICGVVIVSTAYASWRLPEPLKSSTPVAPYAMREYFAARPAMRVMSKEEIALYAIEAERKEQEAFAALPVLTDAQTVALLKMVDFHRQGSTLCRGIAAHIARTTGAHPAYADFHALKEFGLCRPGIDSPWHIHTGKGAEAAQLIAKVKAREIGIHILIEGSKVKATASFTCACGQWRGSFSRGPNGAKAAYGHWSEHVIAAGRVKA